jgi:hypothetical protein
MPRCLAHRRMAVGLWLACAATASTLTTQTALAADATVISNATTVDVITPQVVREFPLNALRGILVIGMTPEATLNGVAVRLAPGARIRGMNNMLALPGSLAGKSLLVHYTVDSYRLVKDVWLLRPEEAAQLWPETPEQAATWRFDVSTKTWVKPG